MSRPIKSFKEFWPYYLNEHRQPATRALHYAGTAAVLAAPALAIVEPWLLPLAPLLGYGPAWAGHFFVEHNRPASLRYPLWSAVADFKMFGLALAGRLDGHLREAEQAAN